MIEEKKFVYPRIKEIIEKEGIVQYYQEWRMSVESRTMIEKISRSTYRVEVGMGDDFFFCCECPSIDRAIEFADAFEDHLGQITYTLGWPNWVSKSKAV